MCKTVVAFLLMLSTPFSFAQTDDDARIRVVALDYIEGWYTGDADRMESALHPDLVKRMVFPDQNSGRSVLDHQSAMTLVQNTRMAYGRQIPKERRSSEVSILDRYQNAASVKVVAADWVDYLHMVKWNGDWKIINVLWALDPPER